MVHEWYKVLYNRPVVELLISQLNMRSRCPVQTSCDYFCMHSILRFRHIYHFYYKNIKFKMAYRLQTMCIRSFLKLKQIFLLKACGSNICQNMSERIRDCAQTTGVERGAEPYVSHLKKARPSSMLLIFFFGPSHQHLKIYDMKVLRSNNLRWYTQI